MTITNVHQFSNNLTLVTVQSYINFLYFQIRLVYITASDIAIAKNYLTELELNQLNLIVSLYIDFAELQASSGRLMKMRDWIKKLDEFLTISEKKLLHSAGRVSAKQAGEKALAEYEKYRKQRDKQYISDFDREVKKLMKKAKK